MRHHGIGVGDSVVFERRSANRRAANAFIAPEFAKDPTDGSAFRPHRVNPKNGMYRGRQVLTVEV